MKINWYSLQINGNKNQINRYELQINRNKNTINGKLTKVSGAVFRHKKTISTYQKIKVTTGDNSMIDYSPLWDTLKERGITQYYLLKNGIDNKTLDSLKKNKNITMLTLEKLCTIIGCTPNDVVRFIKE